MRSRLTAVALALALARPAAAQPPAAPAAGVAATVNGEAVRLDEVDAVIKARIAATPLTPVQLKQLRTEVANDLAGDVLLKQFLRQHGPKVDPAEIDKQVNALSEALAKRGKTLADFCREANQTEAQLREAWTLQTQLTGYVKQQVPDEQLKPYYQANKDHFDRVEVRASHVMVRVGPTATATERAAAKEKLQALRADIEAGRIDFAAAARKHSQCPSAAEGGDLGYVPRKGLLADEAFCKAAFALKVGELSPVVEGEFGYHLIRVAERKAGVASTFEQCLEEVREQFVDDFRAELVAKLRKQADVRVTIP